MKTGCSPWQMGLQIPAADTDSHIWGGGRWQLQPSLNQGSLPPPFVSQLGSLCAHSELFQLWALYSSYNTAVRPLSGSRDPRQWAASWEWLLRGRPGDLQLWLGLHTKRRGAPGVWAQLPVEPGPAQLWRWDIPAGGAKVEDSFPALKIQALTPWPCQWGLEVWTRWGLGSQGDCGGSSLGRSSLSVPASLLSSSLWWLHSRLQWDHLVTGVPWFLPQQLELHLDYRNITWQG